MSKDDLISVFCVNCQAIFEVTKEAADDDYCGYGEDGLAVAGQTAVEVHISWKVTPTKGELCPRCACAVMRVKLNNTEANLPALMKGEYLKEKGK